MDEYFSKSYDGITQHELLNNTRIVYIWAPLEDERIGAVEVPGAQFVVWFWVVGSVVYRAIALAWAVITFIELFASTPGDGTASLLAISYRFINHCAMGIMVFDETLSRTFTLTRTRALANEPCHDLFGDNPVTVWPTRKSWRATQSTYRQMMDKTKYVVGGSLYPWNDG